jgi:hypothetical protein
MLSSVCKSAAVGGVVVAMAAAVSTVALAQGAVRTLSDNEGLFIDGKTLTVTAGRSKDDVASQLGNLSVRALGPGAIVFRSGDRLYMVDGVAVGAAQAIYDPWINRQRSYGGFYDSAAESRRQQSYGGLNDPALDRQRSYGGFYDSAAEWRRQQSYGGLNDPALDRQRSYGGFYDSAAESRRQQSYGGLNDPALDRQRSYGGFYDSAAESRRQQSYGGLYDPALDRQRSYGGFYDSAAESRRQQSYGGLNDPDYANYRLKKVFSAIWGVGDKN